MARTRVDSANAIAMTVVIRPNQTHAGRGPKINRPVYFTIA